MTGPRRDAEPAKRSGRTRAGAWLAAPACALSLTLFPCALHAAPFGLGEVSLAVLGGGSRPLSSLADYQWDVRPRLAWGAETLAGSGPFAAGLRFWSTGTTQALGLSGQPDPAVSATSLELVARARVVTWRVLSLHATASGGRLALRWSPDHVTVDTGGTPVEVELAPVHEWVGGAGLALEAPLPGSWRVGLEGERRVWGLDTAHRSGSAVTYARESFGDWSARFSLRHAWPL